MAYSSSSSSFSIFLFFSVAPLLYSLPSVVRTGISFNKITRTAYAADAVTAPSPTKFSFSGAVTDDSDNAFAPATAPVSHNSPFAADSFISAFEVDSSISAFEIEGTNAPSSSPATAQSRPISTPKVATEYYDMYTGENNFSGGEYCNKGEISKVRETQSGVDNYNYNYAHTKSDSSDGNQKLPNYIAEYYEQIEFADSNLA